MMKTLYLATILSVSLLGTAQNGILHVDSLRAFSGPRIYKDPYTGTILYLESDGRHIASISPDGKLLWNRDPFKDGKLPPYRTSTPQIVYIGPVKSKSVAPAPGKPNEYVGITFNSSQFGLLRIRDGYFEWQGQD